MTCYWHTGTLAHWHTGTLDYWITGLLGWRSLAQPSAGVAPSKTHRCVSTCPKAEVRYDSPRLDRRNSWELGLEKGKKEMNHCY